MKKVALFGGTFNPPHLGHTHLALTLKEKINLDEIVWIPTILSPFKTQENLTPFSHRLKMCQLAIEGIEGFSVDPLERDRTPPAYTIDTVNEILKKRKNIQLYLILGQDQLTSLENWKNVDELLAKGIPLVGTRSNCPDLASLPISDLHTKLIKNCLVKIPLWDISSTAIRDRLKNKLYCNHLLAPSVLDYIQQNHLYY